ncbi:hypothetical protein AVL61_11275 [Kocuria rosea subsp. polaris]|uniref:ARB-07466-like C-terminal domain-containing protein n=1 Tax=Kocuria rosea subsp. polaris TaxID=136273 RepID=A0A0W8IQL3_KOCRO|nr:hypothetical protein [Kocuria polaris]KUG61968.1 hypothetical protein AVL61_11275 [Kocuria polaris]
MAHENTRRRRSGSVRTLVGLLLVLGVLAGALGLLGPGLLGGLRTGGSWLPWGPECTVETAEGEVGLDRAQAKRATTAVALAARGAEAPDTSGIDEAVLQRLADGPPGDAGASLSCRGSAAGGLPEQELTGTGLTPRAERLRAAMTEVFGAQSLGGFAPGGVDHGHGAESTHYDGRAVDVFFRPVTEENRRAGWLLAHWLVAHAEDLDVQYVIFDDRFWSAHSSRGQWRDYDAPEPGNEILRHLDHVHVDVLRGGAG